MTLVPDPAPEYGCPQRVAVLVAHPDDEALWAGGLLLSRPPGSLFIVALCRKGDPDRAPRFRQALACLGAEGAMGDLDDGPGQTPLAEATVAVAIQALLPAVPYDLLLTHGPDGEYTWHRRHVEVARAVRGLLDRGAVRTRRFWQFAYEDQNGEGLPAPRAGASFTRALSPELWARKSRLITQTYGFAPDSWEARAAPRTESFTCYRTLEGLRP